MFTGIIEGLGKVKSIEAISNDKDPGSSKKNLITRKRKPRHDIRRANTTIRIELNPRLAKGLRVGDSVSINGACLTVTKLKNGTADFEMVEETIKRTCLGTIKSGDQVNVERSLQIGDRLEGHMVLGHVDGTALIHSIVTSETETKIWLKMQDLSLLQGIVPKGSIAIDGISLTVVDIDTDKVSVSLIPHTLKLTTLGFKRKQDLVNVEIDIIGKYVAKNLPK